MKIEKLPLASLKPYEKNAKMHPREQIEKIKASIEQFGFNDPIGIWGDTNLIVEGHGRYQALSELGYDEVECIRLDHLTDEQRRAYALAHNKTNMLSDFDFDILGEELADLSAFDMAAFGFEDDGAGSEALALEEAAEVRQEDEEIKTVHCPKCGFAFEAPK